jgi:uncharacterized membrane protein
MSIIAKVGTIVKRRFVSGLLVTVPVIVTYFVLSFMFSALDGMLNPVMRDVLGYNIPGLGAFVTILLILLAGIITTNFIGARLYHYSDRFLGRMPLVRIIYTAAKQLVDSILAPRERAFSEVVMVEYPRKGLYVIGFLSAKCSLQQGSSEEKMAMVFIPSTPTPFSGLVVVVPMADIYPVDISVEAAIKILVSGGIATPKMMKMKNAYLKDEVNDASCQPVG